MNDTLRGRVFTALAFVGPLALYLATASGAVQLDDGAQFVLCAREGSAAHPPGFPLWVALANVWLAAFGSLGSVTALSAFVSVCSAAAVALLYRAFDGILESAFANERPRAVAQIAAFSAALACAGGATVWQWSNTVEVYSLQFLATALVLFGVSRSTEPSRPWSVFTGIGIGVGLANHHVAMVVLLPCAIALVPHPRRQLPALGIAGAITVASYLLLMHRAGGDVQFAFGEPSTPSRLWHHLSGGFFGDSMFRAGVDYGGRAAVLAMVLVRHLWLFVIPLAIGVAVIWRRGHPTATRWLALAAGYPAVLFSLQFARMHTPNMDAGLLPALACASLLVAVGLVRLPTKHLLPLAAVGVVLQVLLNFPACNRRGYDPGDALLRDLDASAPERSILLLTNWELQTVSLLAREERNFRRDLVLLPSSIKGTHKDLLARHYPEFHGAIRADYEAFLAAIAAVDPDFVYTDYFAFGTAAEMDAYAALVRRVFAVAAAEGRAVLCDRATIAFLLAAKVVDGGAVRPCGMLFSVGSRIDPRPFPAPGAWLAHPFLMHDLCAFAVLLDYRTAAQQSVGYFRHHGQIALAEAAERARATLDRVWNEFLAGKPAPRTGP